MPIIGRPDEPEIIAIPRQQTYVVAKGNDLIQKSRDAMTVQQNKIMLFLISKIRPGDTGHETYTVSISEFCKVCNIDYDSGKNHSDAKRALKTLADKSIWLQLDDNTEVLVRWLNRVRLDKVRNTFDISFHEDMLPFLYDLKERYTTYSLEYVLTMRSKYGIRLYELLKSYQHLGKEISFTLEEFKQRLDVRDYDRYPDLRRRVIEPAINDINECSDMQVDYYPYNATNGRSVEYITFVMREPDSLDEHIRKIRRRRELTPTRKKKDPAD